MKKQLRRYAVGGGMLAAMAVGAARADVVSVFGDIDGFGCGAPEVDGELWRNTFGGTLFADYRADHDRVAAPFTDRWDAHGPDLSWTHTYAAEEATGAVLHLYVVGLADTAPMTLNVDGSPVAIFAFFGMPYTTHILDVEIPAEVLDGNTTFSLSVAEGDAFMVDYAQLTVAAAPGPTALTGIGLIAALIRRRRS